MVAPQLRSMARVAQCFCWSLPIPCRIPANTVPARYMNAAGLAPRTNSLIAQATMFGAGTPPTSSSSPMRNHSPSCQARTDFLNGSGM